MHHVISFRLVAFNGTLVQVQGIKEYLHIV